MIISASRRTDIPAWYSAWFMNRIRDGYCLVPNPMNMKQVARISLYPQDVEAIVFWSKNPEPLIYHLEELDNRGFKYYFQFTLNDYPVAIEPYIPTLENRLDTFKILSQRIGVEKVVWRYDPIIVSNYTDVSFHEERFTQIAEELKGKTKRVMVSFCDFYNKTERRLGRLEKEEGYLIKENFSETDEAFTLMEKLARISHSCNIEIFTCAESRNFTGAGVAPGKCIDDKIISRITNNLAQYKKDPFQRESCLCMISKDIGINDTCIHGCLYCYSTRSLITAERRHKEHDPTSPTLWGNFNETVKERVKSNQLSLFNSIDNS